MKVARLAVAFGVGILAASVGFVACGGDDSSPSIPGNDAGPDGTVRDSGPGIDTGAIDARIDDDARVPSPGRVKCGSNACNTDTEYCCVSDDAGYECLAESAECTGGTEVACDEKADCDDTEVCCGSATLGGDFSVECATSCNGGLQRRICKSNEECGDAGPCVPQTCFGVPIQTCGGIQGNPNCTNN